MATTTPTRRLSPPGGQRWWKGRQESGTRCPTSSSSGRGCCADRRRAAADGGAEQPPSRACGDRQQQRGRRRVSDTHGRWPGAEPGAHRRFRNTVPEMLTYLEANTPLRTQRVENLHDYDEAIIDRVPGCRPFSRAVEPLPFAAQQELGEWAELLATRSTLLSLGASTTLQEAMSARGGVSANLDELATRDRDGQGARPDSHHASGRARPRLGHRRALRRREHLGSRSRRCLRGRRHTDRFGHDFRLSRRSAHRHPARESAVTF